MTQHSNNSIVDFLLNRKKEDAKVSDTINWNKRKDNFVESLESLHKLVDKLIVYNFEEAGYKIETSKSVINITEDFIGQYQATMLVVKADDIEIKFVPVGAVVTDAKGRVDMVFPFEIIKIILDSENKWTIVEGISPFSELKDFNEGNVLKLLQENF